MTENEKFMAVDLVLSKMTPNDPTDLSAFSYWIKIAHENDSTLFPTIANDRTDSSYNIIHGFLLENEYIERIQINSEIKKLTPIGVEAKKRGGHLKYLAYLRKEKRDKTIKEVIIYIFIPVVTLLTLWFTIFPLKRSNMSSPINNKDTATQVNPGSKTHHP